MFSKSRPFVMILVQMGLSGKKDPIVFNQHPTFAALHMN